MFKKIAITFALLIAAGFLALGFLVFFSVRARMMQPAPTLVPTIEIVQKPTPTLPPEPTATQIRITKAAYISKLGDYFNKTNKPTMDMLITQQDAALSGFINTTSKKSLYSDLDEMIDLTKDMMNEPCAAGFEEVQRKLEMIHEEYLGEKFDLMDAFENRNASSFEASTEHTKKITELTLSIADFITAHK